MKDRSVVPVMMPGRRIHSVRALAMRIADPEKKSRMKTESRFVVVLGVSVIDYYDGGNVD